MDAVLSIKIPLFYFSNDVKFDSFTSMFACQFYILTILQLDFFVFCFFKVSAWSDF